MERPDVNVKAGFVEAGWRLYRFGKWHNIVQVLRCFGRDANGAVTRWMFIRTDDERAFHVNPEILVAAEAD